MVPGCRPFLPVVLAIALLAPIARAAEPVPLRLTHAGRLLTSDDEPVSAVLNLTFTINTYSGVDPAAPNEVKWSATYTAVTVSDGLYSVVLGEPPGTPILSTVFEGGGERWIGLRIGDGAELRPRQRVTSAPYALVAGNALTIGGLSIADLDARYASATGAKYVELQGESTTAQAGNAHVAGSVTALGFSGDGANLVNLAAGAITGTLDPERLPVASSTSAGSVNTGTQAFGGSKTFDELSVLGDLTVTGRLRLGYSASECNASLSGALRFNPTGGVMEFCSGGNWQPVAPNLSTAFATTTCDARTEGTLRYDTATKRMQFCNGTTWGNAAPDFTPEPVVIPAKTDAIRDTTYTSTAVTVQGIDAGTPVSLSGGGAGGATLSIAGGPPTTYGFVSPGQTLVITTKSSSAFGGSVSVTVTVGTSTSVWTISNAGQDIAPTPFNFGDVTNASPNTLYTAASLNINGMDPGVPVSVTGTGNPQVSIAGGAWGAGGTIDPGQTLAVRLTASPTSLEARSASVTVGSYTTTWTVTTGASLYPFTSHTFSHCSATGRLGPTLAACRSAYSSTSWAANSQFFGMTSDNGVQLWTVPATANYRIEAWGARGGNATSYSTYGWGARMRGDFALTQGQVLKLVVGQVAADHASQGGGGGGSFVVNNQGNTPLLIAGGGGGGYATCSANVHGTTSTTARVTDQGSAATGGNGGPGFDAGGGGGLLTNGVASNSNLTYGYSFVSGGALGGLTSGGTEGGFGGGGGSHSGRNAGGGGGGYSGGGGGNSQCGAGGGSYNAGANPNNTEGESVTNPPLNGQIIITKL